jgi:NTE family protein
MGKKLSRPQFSKYKYYQKLDRKMYKFPFEYMVIEGGGMKIVPVCGSIRALYEYNILQSITKFAGSSAGAILATALACGYTPLEIDTLMLDTDFTKFQDDKFGFVRDSVRLSAEYGVCPGIYFLNWIGDKIKIKLGKYDATFKDLKDFNGNMLYITSLCVDDDITRIFSYENSPDMKISTAVRMSMSIPVFFCPVKYEGKYYVDGGVSNNYPINIFEIHGKTKTLGLKLMGLDEKRDDRIYNGVMNTSSLVNFYGSIMSHILNEMERREINETYWDRTISINTGSIGTMEFDITREKRMKYVKICYEETIIALEKFKKNKTFK